MALVHSSVTESFSPLVRRRQHQCASRTSARCPAKSNKAQASRAGPNRLSTPIDHLADYTVCLSVYLSVGQCVSLQTGLEAPQTGCEAPPPRRLQRAATGSLSLKCGCDRSAASGS